MEKFSAIGKSKIKNINVKSEGDMKKDEYYNDKVDVCSPDGIFALKLNVYYIIGSIEKDPDILQKGIRSILCFFMTSYATMFYRGKGEFTAFTLNTKGVVSLIMLIMPIVLDFVFMWIHRKECE